MGLWSGRSRRELQRAMAAHPAGKARVAGDAAMATPEAIPVRRVSSWNAVPDRPRQPVRLSARGWRLVAAVTLVVVAAAAVGVGALLGGSAGEDLRLVGQTRVVVHSGDTLWSLASSVAREDQDVREVVYRIRRINRLQDGDLQPGQVLLLP